MNPKFVALIGIAGLIAGTLIPLTPVMGAENSSVRADTAPAQRPGALQIKSTAPVKAAPIRFRCDLSALWYGEPCHSIAKI